MDHVIVKEWENVTKNVYVKVLEVLGCLLGYLNVLECVINLAIVWVQINATRNVLVKDMEILMDLVTVKE